MRQWGELDRAAHLKPSGSTHLLICYIESWIKRHETRVGRPSLMKVTNLGAAQWYNCLCAELGQLPRLVRKKENIFGTFLIFVFGKFVRVFTLSLIDFLLHIFQLESFLWRSPTQRWRSRWYGAIFTVSHRWYEL